MSSLQSWFQLCPLTSLFCYICPLILLKNLYPPNSYGFNSALSPFLLAISVLSCHRPCELFVQHDRDCPTTDKVSVWNRKRLTTSFDWQRWNHCMLFPQPLSCRGRFFFCFEIVETNNNFPWSAALQPGKPIRKCHGLNTWQNLPNLSHTAADWC